MRAENATAVVDGNAAAGMLADVFTGDVTTIVGVCGGCGSIAPLADSHVTTGSDSDYRLDDGKPCTRDPATGEFILSQTGERFRAERI